MIVTWTGNGFSGGISVSSQFFDDQNNNPYYYDQNYNGFFPVVINGLTVTYPTSGGYNAIILPSGTVLTSIDSLQSSISGISNTILQGRLHQYKSKPSNIIDIYSSNPGDFVVSTVTQALSGTNITNALATAASYFVDSSMNFAISEISSRWPMGTQIIQELNVLLQNQQANLTDQVGKASRIADFKKKLIRLQVETANQVRKVQGTVDKYEQTDTFSALASAFPTTMGQLKNALGNQNSFLKGGLAGVLPSSNLSGFVENIFNSVFPNQLPKIVNPVDKLLIDINNLISKAGTLGDKVPINGFGSLLEQQNFVNQAVSLTNNAVAKIPVTPSKPAIAALTDPAAILTSVNDYASAQLGKVISNAQNTANQASTNLTQIMNQVGPTVASLPDPIDALGGGSFANLPSLSGVLSEVDQSITPPNVSISPDPSIATNTINRAIGQAKADAASVLRKLSRGSGINILDEVPLRPRNTPVDGSKGDYTVIPGIEI